MKVLIIGTDRKLFEGNSGVRSRMIEYSSLVEELTVIVFSTRHHGCRPVTVSSRLRLIPTNSLNRWMYICDAIRLSLGAGGVDVVSAQDPAETGIVAYILAKILKAGLHIQLHGDIFGKEFRRESLLNRFRYCIARYLVPRAQGVRVVSERIKRAMCAAYPKGAVLPHTTVLPIFVPNHFDENRDMHLRSRYQQFGTLVLMVSRLAKEKDIHVGIDAFVLARQHVPDMGLLIVGDGPERKYLEHYATQKGVAESVVFCGWQEDTQPFYAAADIYMLTSRHEGYARTLVEAAYGRCAIVTTDVGVAGDVFVDTKSARVCPVGDAVCCSRALVRLSRDTQTRDFLAINAYQVATTETSTRSSEGYSQDLVRSWRACVGL